MLLLSRICRVLTVDALTLRALQRGSAVDVRSYESTLAFVPPIVDSLGWKAAVTCATILPERGLDKPRVAQNDVQKACVAVASKCISKLALQALRDPHMNIMFSHVGCFGRVIALPSAYW